MSQVLTAAVVKEQEMIKIHPHNMKSLSELEKELISTKDKLFTLIESFAPDDEISAISADYISNFKLCLMIGMAITLSGIRKERGHLHHSYSEVQKLCSELTAPECVTVEQIVGVILTKGMLKRFNKYPFIIKTLKIFSDGYFIYNRKS